jgi:hypothetical protein
MWSALKHLTGQSVCVMAKPGCVRNSHARLATVVRISIACSQLLRSVCMVGGGFAELFVTVESAAQISTNSIWLSSEFLVMEACGSGRRSRATRA